MSSKLSPHQPVLVVFFQGKETGGILEAGDDAEDVGFFSLADLPGEIAFAAHRDVLSELALLGSR